MGDYLNKPVGELARELRAGLLRLRKGYIDSAEALLRIIKPEVDYPYELLVYRLTGYRPARRQPIRPLSGRALKADLQRLILDICDSFDLPVEAYAEPVFDTPALAARFRISTKTIQRWRRRGLVARRLVFSDGKKRIAFLDSAVHAFAERRRRGMLRSVRFTQMSDAERDDIIRRARRMVACTDCCIHEVSKRLAARTGRAVETIRYTIRRHDQENPQQAVFAHGHAPIDDQAKEVVYRCFLQGVSVTSLAGRYRRTRGTMYRIVNEMRARQLLGRKIEYVYNPQFDLPAADEMILTDRPEEAPRESRPPKPRLPRDLPPYLKSLYELPLLSRQQERRLFQKYNYLKYRADQMRRRIDLNSVKAAQLARIERLLVQADAVKNQIIRANLRLVVSIAKRHVNGPQTLFELISDGNVSLMRAVEKFDYSKGFKFSTYGSWAIMKNFARSVPRERYLLDRFATGHDEIVELAGGMSHWDSRATSLAELRESLEVVLAQLAPRERSIIVHHFGLGTSGEVQTLEQLSRSLGISKERVRQIERRAMEKLRTMLKPEGAELLR